MELLRLKFLFGLLFLRIAQCLVEPKASVVSHSIVSICKSSLRYFDLHVISSLDPQAKVVTSEWIKEISQGLHQSLHNENTIHIEEVEHVVAMGNRKRSASIILVNSYESFEKVQLTMSQAKFNSKGFYLLVVPESVGKFMDKIFEKLWKLLMFNVDVLVYNEEGNISLFTFFPFSEGTCNNLKPTKINEFDNETLQWENQNFFPNKMRNLEKCSLRVGTYDSAPGLMIRVVNNVTQVYGFEGEMFNLIAERLNFTMNIKVVTYGGGSVNENGTATGLVEKVMQKEFDMMFSLFSSNYLRMIYLSPTKSYYVDKMIVITPSDRLLDSFLKLFYVFDLALWITLLSIFTLAIVSIQVVKMTCPRFNEMFLKELRTPFLSVLVAFVGGSERTTPKKDFPRILFATFLIFFLVVRSIYQGALFNLLKKDIQVNEIKTIEDVNKLQFTFYIMQSTTAKTSDLKIFHR